MEVLRKPPIITSHQVGGSNTDTPSDQDTFRFREQPSSNAGDHDVWIPIETINQSPHKPGQSGAQEDQPGTSIFEIGQNDPITFDDYSFF